MIIDRLNKIWHGISTPFLIYKEKEFKFSQFNELEYLNLSQIKKGSVVSIIGDFNLKNILTILRLIDLGAIIVPLTNETKNDHEYFFKSALVDYVIKDDLITKLTHTNKHDLIEDIRSKNDAGLILFSTGTTGKPKAILHNLTSFLKKYNTPRPAFKTINFLLFDHIGGINTLFHTLFNKGTVIVPESRTVETILETCKKYNVELLPTTPTFLRLMLMSGSIPNKVPKCIKVMTYGTERMDQSTLNDISELLPNIDLRQTFGMSELGILRVKSESRNSLFMKIGGEGIETRVKNNILEIRSKSRMLGYLNAPSPFDSDGWYNTRDLVETKDDFIKIVGRDSEVINVGGLKFLSTDIEKIVLKFPDILFVKVIAKKNPITGEHVELIIQPANEIFDIEKLKVYLKKNLQNHMMPRKISLEKIKIGHRFKKN